MPAAPTERAEGVPDGEGAISPEVVRRAKVAEARIKIMNGYYARRDVQRRLAERLALELR